MIDGIIRTYLTVAACCHHLCGRDQRVEFGPIIIFRCLLVVIYTCFVYLSCVVLLLPFSLQFFGNFVEVGT